MMTEKIQGYLVNFRRVPLICREGEFCDLTIRCYHNGPGSDERLIKILETVHSDRTDPVTLSVGEHAS